MVGKINGASPDAEVDIIFGKVTFKCLNVGDANITIQPTPSEDTIIGLSLTKYDSFIIGFCKGDFDSDGDMEVRIPPCLREDSVEVDITKLTITYSEGL